MVERLCCLTGLLAVSLAAADTPGQTKDDERRYGPVRYRVNAGATEPYTDALGRTWQADGFFQAPSSAIQLPPRAQARLEVSNLPAGLHGHRGDTTALYGRQRYGTRTQRGVVYEFPVLAPGVYTVQLHFVELFAAVAEPGARVFELLLEQEPRATVDIAGAAGHRRLHLETVSATVTDSAVSVELFGLVRTPVVSAIEVFGPIDGRLRADEGGLEPLRHTSSVDGPVLALQSAASFLPPPTRATIELTPSGETYTMAMASTDIGHRDSLRFSTAYLTGAKVFRLDSDDGEVIDTFEPRCAALCSARADCAGFFTRVLTSGPLFCSGLSDLGRPVGTASAVSRSWARVGLRGNSVALPVAAAGLSSAALLSASGTAAASFQLAFEGKTTENPVGPWLAFSTCLQRIHHLFRVRSFDLEMCLLHCQSITQCHGVEFSVEENDNTTLCTGLGDLGTKRGGDTMQSSVSLIKRPPPPPALVAWNGSSTTVPATQFEMVDTRSESSSSLGRVFAGSSAGVGLVIAVLIVTKATLDHTVTRDIDSRLGMPQESGLSHTSGSSFGTKSAWDDINDGNGTVLVEPPEPCFWTDRSAGEKAQPLGGDIYRERDKPGKLGKRLRTRFDRAQSNNTDSTELSEVNTLNSVSTSQLEPVDVIRTATFERRDSSELIISSQRRLHTHESSSAMSWDDSNDGCINITPSSSSTKSSSRSGISEELRSYGEADASHQNPE